MGMNMTDIFSGEKNALDKFAAFYRSQSTFSSGGQKLQQGRYTIKKLKMEQGEGLLVVPLMIHLPISFEGDVLETPMPYIGSFESAIKMIKMLCSRNANYCTALTDLLGTDFTALNLDSPDVSSEESAVFRRFRKPLIYAHTVMTVKAADSKYQFGTPYRVEVVTDPKTGDYIEDPNNPLIYKLHTFESACLATQVKQLRAENEEKGAARRPDAEIDQTIKNLWDNRCISNPYNLGTTRVLFFKTNRNYEVLDSTLKSWDPKSGKLQPYEFYIKVNKAILEVFEQAINTKYDKYDDFLLFRQSTPEFNEKTRGTAAQKITRTSAGTEDSIADQLDRFSDAYRNYRDDIEAWDEKVILKSAFEYRTISDSAITDIFKNSMSTLSAAVRTAEIAEKYSEVIRQLDSNLSDDLLQSAMVGELPQAGDTSKELAAAPQVTENTPGYGGDTTEDSMIAEDMIAALAASTT